jgi:hypothetical protein
LISALMRSRFFALSSESHNSRFAMMKAARIW